MATYCGTCLGEICDFCKWYDFNGDEDGCYTGDGYCRLLKVQCDPDDGFGCPDFFCNCAKEGDSFSTVQI